MLEMTNENFARLLNGLTIAVENRKSRILFYQFLAAEIRALHYSYGVGDIESYKRGAISDFSCCGAPSNRRPRSSMARATHRPAWSATCPQRMAIDSGISSLGLRRLFRRRTELHCACRACARGPRFPHQAERFETNDLAVRKCRRRMSGHFGRSGLFSYGPGAVICAAAKGTPIRHFIVSRMRL